jgi:plasmid stability protein
MQAVQVDPTSGADVPTLMSRKMDKRVKAELRALAARRGVSMEQHVRPDPRQVVRPLT